MNNVIEIGKFEKALSMIKQTLDFGEIVTDLDIEEFLCPDDEDQFEAFMIYLEENNIRCSYNEKIDKYVYCENKGV